MILNPIMLFRSLLKRRDVPQPESDAALIANHCTAYSLLKYTVWKARQVLKIPMMVQQGTKDDLREALTYIDMHFDKLNADRHIDGTLISLPYVIELCQNINMVHVFKTQSALDYQIQYINAFMGRCAYPSQITDPRDLGLY